MVAAAVPDFIYTKEAENEYMQMIQVSIFPTQKLPIIFDRWYDYVDYFGRTIRCYAEDNGQLIHSTCLDAPYGPMTSLMELIGDELYLTTILDDKDVKAVRVLEKMTVEILLESYEKNALPELPPGFMGTHFVRSDDRINRLLQLEASWKVIVKNADELTKQTRALQEAIWEFISTERSYILILKLAVDVYIAVLLELQQRGYLNNVNIVDLFGNIKELYSIHLDYWTSTITPVLQSFRQTCQPLNHEAVNELYDQLADRLQKPYLRYLQNASESIDYGRELTQRLSEFSHYAEWCQRQRPIRVAGNSQVIQNLSLDSIQSNPHQRITRYGILLDSIVKRSLDKEALNGTSKRVETLCRWLNNRVKLGELEKRVKSVSFIHFKVNSTQVDHELTRLKEIKSSFDLKAPMPACQAAIKREVFIEIDQITMRHGELQKAVPVVICILTDVMLICQTPPGKQTNRLMKELILCRAPLRTDRLNPIISSQPQTRVYILSLTEYGCPDGCYQFDFQNELDKTKFLAKLDEARKTYKAIQQGQTDAENALNQLDRNFQSNQLDSDPDSPDECVIGGAVPCPDAQLLAQSNLTVDAEAALLGFGTVPPPISPVPNEKKKKKGLFRFKKSKKAYKIDD